MGHDDSMNTFGRSSLGSCLSLRISHFVPMSRVHALVGLRRSSTGTFPMLTSALFDAYPFSQGQVFLRATRLLSLRAGSHLWMIIDHYQNMYKIKSTIVKSRRIPARMPITLQELSTDPGSANIPVSEPEKSFMEPQRPQKPGRVTLG